MFNSIKKHFDEGRYTEEQAQVFVKAKWITDFQYKEITGIEYVA